MAAKRDMTEAQMRKAAKAAGFEPWALGLWDISTGKQTTSYGWIMFKRRGEWKVHYRTSLAEAIRKRKANLEKKSERQAA